MALLEVLWRAAQAAGVLVRTSTAIHSATLEGSQRVLRDAQVQAWEAVDLVVDASGAGSRLSPLRARPLAYGAIWGTARWPSETALPFNELRQRCQGASHMVGVLPVGRLSGAPEPRAALLSSMPASALDGWAQTDVTAWQAEALALFTALQHHPQTEALPRYAAMRRRHVRSYQTMSAIFTPMYPSGSRVLPLLRDQVLAPCAQLPGIKQMLTALVSGDLLAPLGPAHPLKG